MKFIAGVILVVSLMFGGRLGIGISGGGQYEVNFGALKYETLPALFYGGEFHLQAEALPSMYLEPLVLYLNDGNNKVPAGGVGLRINVAPRLGRFFLAPFFGLEGDILFYNSGIDLNQALMNNQLAVYFRESSPKTAGLGFGGVSLYFSKSLSLDCQYRYYSFGNGIGIKMAWAGFTYYINW
ncbi:MAG: hypothetical protein ABIL70_03035 [candidate division WOR-3 bacterium]